MEDCGGATLAGEGIREGAVVRVGAGTIAAKGVAVRGASVAFEETRVPEGDGSGRVDVGVGTAIATCVGSEPIMGFRLATCSATPRSAMKKLAPLDALATSKASCSSGSAMVKTGTMEL